MSTPPSTAMVLMVLASTLTLILTPPAAAAPWCGVRVDETAGEAQPDGSKLYHVTVSNQGSAWVRDVHLNCGVRFQPVRPVEPTVLNQVGPRFCLLLDGGAIVPGGKVTFGYTSNVRYTMDLVSAVC